MGLLLSMATSWRSAQGQVADPAVSGQAAASRVTPAQLAPSQLGPEQVQAGGTAVQTPGLANRDEKSKPPLTQKQRDLQADVARLRIMAAELKISVDKSTKDQLSLDVVRKADQIEKLAKSVKERMRVAQ